MRSLRVVFVAFVASLIAVVFLTPARADDWSKKTVLTFNEPIEVPGKVLPPGTYIFKLLDNHSYRHIVQIWNEDGRELITTVLAIPDYRLEPTGETVMKFHERPGDAPDALRAWFYPGDLFGQEFVYPKARAFQLAEASKQIVPAETVEPTQSTLTTVPLIAVTPDRKEESLTEAIQVLPLRVPADTSSLAAKELPKTASSTPLVGLLGLASIGLAIGLKLLIKHVS